MFAKLAITNAKKSKFKIYIFIIKEGNFMENASKALLIAAAVLIVILLLKEDHLMKLINI